MKRVSIVVPCYNEEETIDLYYNEVINKTDLPLDKVLNNYNEDKSIYLDDKYVIYYDSDYDCIFVDLIDEYGDDLGGNFTLIATV